MTDIDTDVVIVGARCAGASLASFLRKHGVAVLLVDKDALPSEYVLSTHTVHSAGMAVLDELGLGARVRAGAPAMRKLRFEKDGGVLHMHFAEADAEYCPRRGRLDGILLDAALEAGATVMDRTRCVGLIADAGRVTGVRLQHREQSLTVRARWVVGADGRQSFVANALNLPAYHAYDAPRAMFWGYFPAPRDYESAMHITFRAGDVSLAFATEHTQVLVSVLPTVDEARAYARDPLRALRCAVATDPYYAALVQAEPSEPMRGVVKARYGMRQPIGDGWALVGDAAMTRDPLAGDGITDALIQARALADVLASSDPALRTPYWHARDRAALPSYLFYKAQGEPGPRPRFEALIQQYVDEKPALKHNMVRMLRRELTPLETLSPYRLLGFLARALLHGEHGVLRDFAKMGATARAIERALAEVPSRTISRDERAFSS